jgi:hypothetical protein
MSLLHLYKLYYCSSTCHLSIVFLLSHTPYISLSCGTGTKAKLMWRTRLAGKRLWRTHQCYNVTTNSHKHGDACPALEWMLWFIVCTYWYHYQSKPDNKNDLQLSLVLLRSFPTLASISATASSFVSSAILAQPHPRCLSIDTLL